MIRLFKSLHPSVYFTLVVMAIILWIPGFFKEPFLVASQKGFLIAAINDLLLTIPSGLLAVLTIILICLEALYLNAVVNRHGVLYKNTNLPAVMYILLMSFNRDVIGFHIIHLVNLGTIFLLDKLFSLFKNESSTSTIFDCGLLVALLSMFYVPAAGLLIFLLIALIVMRPFIAREWLVAVVGFLVPYLFLAVYYFFTDKLSQEINSTLQLSVFGIPQRLIIIFFKEPDYLLFSLYLGFVLFLALLKLSANFFKNSIKTRATQQILLFLSIVLVAVSFLLQSATMFYYLQLTIPFSVFLAYYYATAKKRLWMYEFSFWIFIGLIVMSYS
jgi:hypothetical protein